MKNLFEDSHKKEIISRVNLLTSESKPIWGKMNAAQMLAHSIMPFKLTLTDPKPPRKFLWKVIGGLVKKVLLSERPFKKSAPAPKRFKVETPQNFDLQKEKIIATINRFRKGSITDFVHPLFGKMDESQWGWLQYKHLDHHLRQFGV